MTGGGPAPAGSERVDLGPGSDELGTGLWHSATTADVTPTGGPLAGYLARGDTTATGAHDRLTASLVWLGGPSEESGVCWIALDALSIDADTAARIRSAVGERAGIAPDAVLVCCSHTHSGPSAWPRPAYGTSPWPAAEDTAIDRLVADLARAAGRLRSTRCPVTAGWSGTRRADVGGNRYDPDGPHEKTVGALTLRDPDGTVVAVVFDYACHPTVLDHTNLEFSADYPGTTRRIVRAALAEAEGVETPPVVAFLQGAAGDASTRFTRRDNDFAEMTRQGGMLAGTVLAAVLDGEGAPVGAEAPLRRRTTIRVPTRALPGAKAAKRALTSAEAAWHQVPEDQRNTPAGRIARTRYEGAFAQSALRDAGVPAEVDLPITVVALGDVAWAHLPVEPFESWAAQIRAASPFPVTRVVGYTDGYFGYLADADAHDRGHYEALSSLFDAAAGTTVVAETVALLHELRAG